MPAGKILAIETSALQAVVCAIDFAAGGGRIAASTQGTIEVAHSEALLPLVHRVLESAQWSLADLGGLAVGVGPGSFTGVRIGCATIKALAQVLRTPITPFSSLRALALSVPPLGGGQVVAMANAYQGQVFVGWTVPGSGSWREEAASPDAWIAEWAAARGAATGAEPTVFGGSGARLYWSQISGGPGASLSEVAYASPDGVRMAVAETDKTVDYLHLAANYIRPSQAEAKLSLLANGKGA